MAWASGTICILIVKISYILERMQQEDSLFLEQWNSDHHRLEDIWNFVSDFIPQQLTLFSLPASLLVSFFFFL